MCVYGYVYVYVSVCVWGVGRDRRFPINESVQNMVKTIVMAIWKDP